MTRESTREKTKVVVRALFRRILINIEARRCRELSSTEKQEVARELVISTGVVRDAPTEQKEKVLAYECHKIIQRFAEGVSN